MQYDGAIRNRRHEPKYTKLEYKLVDSEGNKYTKKGAHIIVEGGYHKTWSIRLRWRCTVCSFKAFITQAKRSERLESAGKGVKCFFGRTKGRWRILKLPLQYWYSKRIYNIFFSCCILKNMLHAYDG
ncbi:unnamed protein product, partial [Discosporangium mesarthrocarpum]